MYTLVVQSFGKETEYKRAILTVLSFYAHTSADLSNHVILFTDRPEYFAHFFEGLPVRFVLLTEDKIKQMRGQIDFLHRMKIALIEEAFTLSTGNILYADSDTFFTADPTFLMDQLSPSKSYMHIHEYNFEEMRHMPMPAGLTFRAYLRLIEQGPLLLANGDQIRITPQHSSWNAGVMMLHKEHAAFIPDVYALTEQTYPSTSNHASEQYAFSIMLQEKTNLRPCNEVIYHYWYRVKKQIIDEYLQDKLDVSFVKKNISEKLKIVQTWTRALPDIFKNHVLMLRDNAIQYFNENKFYEGYKWAFKALLNKPVSNDGFFLDVLYHFKRQVLKNDSK